MSALPLSIDETSRRLVLFREALGYTQAEFARFLGIQVQRIGNAETGWPLSRDLAILIADRTGIPCLDYLYLGRRESLPISLARAIDQAAGRSRTDGRRRIPED